MTARKLKPATDRVCAVCGANAGREGPLEHAWDQHLVVLPGELGGLVFSCSAKCRAARGWAERKGVA